MFWLSVLLIGCVVGMPFAGRWLAFGVLGPAGVVVVAVMIDRGGLTDLARWALLALPVLAGAFWLDQRTASKREAAGLPPLDHWPYRVPGKARKPAPR